MHKYSVHANYYCLKQSTFYKEPVLLAVLDNEKVSTRSASKQCFGSGRKFLSLPDPLVRDTDPDPSIIMQK
jgi:hypothetical protein